MTSCDIDYPIDTPEAAEMLALETEVLAEKWRFAISLFDNLESIDDIKFDHSAWIQLGLQEILTDKVKMSFAQELNAKGAKLLHTTFGLDDNTIPLAERYAIIQKIMKITQQSFECKFVDLP